MQQKSIGGHHLGYCNSTSSPYSWWTCKEASIYIRKCYIFLISLLMLLELCSSVAVSFTHFTFVSFPSSPSGMDAFSIGQMMSSSFVPDWNVATICHPWRIVNILCQLSLLIKGRDFLYLSSNSAWHWDKVIRKGKTCLSPTIISPVIGVLP